ncbi:MAG: alpha-glucosidase C-terminal domain-containing protein, partial [Bacteroidota bacterium]
RANGAVKGETKKLEQGNVVEGDQEEVRQVNALDIDQLLAHKDSLYQKGYAMHFTSNHDENAWAGTVFQRMGDAHLAFAVLTATFDGMPLIYGGMESAMDKQLAFFEKDTIPWGEYSYERFYRTLFELKHRNQALWNGDAGGPLTKIATGADDKVYAFMREKNGDQVIVAINLSGEKQNIRLQSDRINGEYTEVFNNFKLQMINGQEFQLEPWTYRVFSNK